MLGSQASASGSGSLVSGFSVGGGVGLGGEVFYSNHILLELVQHEVEAVLQTEGFNHLAFRCTS